MMRRNLWLLFLVALPMCASLETQANTSLTPLVQFSVRDLPEDGVPDTILPSSDISWRGQVTGPGSTDLQDQTFLEYDLRSLAPQQSATLHLVLYHGGTDKLLPVSTYVGDGAASLSDWGAGDYLTTIQLPFLSLSGSQISASIDVTSIVNSYILAGREFLGIRLHDVVYVPGSDGDQAQVAIGDGGGVFPQILELEPTPEPSTALLALCAAASLCLARRRSGL